MSLLWRSEWRSAVQCHHFGWVVVHNFRKVLLSCHAWLRHGLGNGAVIYAPAFFESLQGWRGLRPAVEEGANGPGDRAAG